MEFPTHAFRRVASAIAHRFAKHRLQQVSPLTDEAHQQWAVRTADPHDMEYAHILVGENLLVCGAPHLVAVLLFARPAHIGCLSHAALKYVLKVNRDVHGPVVFFIFTMQSYVEFSYRSDVFGKPHVFLSNNCLFY